MAAEAQSNTFIYSFHMLACWQKAQATVEMWRPEDNLGDSVPPLHHEVIGTELSSSDLVIKVTLSTKPFSLIPGKYVLVK